MKKVFLYWIDIILNVLLTISFSIAGYYSLHYKENLSLLPYQIAMMSMLVSGMWLYRKEQGSKELNKELIKATIIAIVLPIVTININGEFDFDDFGISIGSLIHAVFLKLFIKFIVERNVKLIGDRAYITTSISIILIVVLLIIGVNMYVSVAVSLFVMEPINYFEFKKKYRMSKNERDASSQT